MPPRLEALVTEFSKRDSPDIIQNGKVPLSDFGGSVTLKLLDRNGVKAEARLCFSCTLTQGTCGNCYRPQWFSRSKMRSGFMERMLP